MMGDNKKNCSWNPLPPPLLLLLLLLLLLPLIHPRPIDILLILINPTHTMGPMLYMIVRPPRGCIILRRPILTVMRERVAGIYTYHHLLLLQGLPDQPFSLLDHRIWLFRRLTIRVLTACIAMTCLRLQIHPIQSSMYSTLPMKIHMILLLLTLPSCVFIDLIILHIL